MHSEYLNGRFREPWFVSHTLNPIPIDESEIHLFSQILSRLEVRHVLSRNLDPFARHWIASRPGFPVVQLEASETANLRPVISDQMACKGIKDRRNHELGIFVL